MSPREGFLILLLVVCSTFADARNLIIDMPSAYTIPNEIEVSSVDRNEQLCTLCEEYTARATEYLSENKTQAEIIGALHQKCAELRSYERQCVVLVDYYASLFFVEIGKIHPEKFCEKVNLCEKAKHLYSKNEDTCTLCHRVVVEVLTKLKDPDTEFGIVQLLLKECRQLGNYAQECKKLVFQYGPLILVNGEKFLETTDVCASIHACHASQKEALVTALPADGSLADA